MLMVLRGKTYLRMQYTPAEVAVLRHATAIFTTASQAAIVGLAHDLTL